VLGDECRVTCDEFKNESMIRARGRKFHKELAITLKKPLETIGSRLRRARATKELTIPEVSDKTGISRGNLSHLENDKGKPSSEALIQLSALYEVTTDWILKGGSYDGAKFGVAGVREKKGIYQFKAPSGQTEPPSEELMGFINSILETWGQCDTVTRGWIVGQLRKAFPEMAETLRKDH
jgi:transcriptional regulator with XRE-family HTH domain